MRNRHSGRLCASERPEIPPPQGSCPDLTVVAVIDGGFDFTHPDLRERVWINASETPDNGLDDDGNGYADDLHGWNFLGNACGEDFLKAGTAQFRDYKRLRPRYKNADTCRLNRRQRAEYALYKRMEREARLDTYILYAQYLGRIARAYEVCDSLMKACYGDKATTIGDFLRIEVADTTGLGQDLQIAASRPAVMQPDASWNEVVRKAAAEYDTARKRVESLDRNDDDPHLKLGNDPDDFRNFRYGNNHIHCDPYHGTMVSGVIAACTAAPGVEQTVKIMGIRAVPEGDEYDRDIAAAIRYAVDNGARVVNMSFGKYASHYSKEVQQAIRHAARRDVLLVMASGNDGRDIDLRPIYPRNVSASGRRHENMLVVGSTDRRGRVCDFSNYGCRTVDLFAPGSDILSTAPEGRYDAAMGTSISAPMVAGVAALIRSVCPDLKAAEVRRILLETVRDLSHVETPIPGTKGKQTGFSGDLCLSRGMLDANAALGKALEISITARR
ncbi:S8 family serine peptidase [Alistipes sp.]|uniref:S8 family serine peptidase n=1 Tax=Alistipes sp. TaxID=1872444 RepID=UPI003AF01F1C